MNDSAKTKAALLDEVRALRWRAAELEAGQHRFAFLAEASAILAASLDYAATQRSVAQLAVPRVADWCSVDLVVADGTLERLAVAHVDPAKVAWAYEIQCRYPPNPAAPTGVFNAMRTGKPQLYAEITDEMLAAAARDEEHLRLLRGLGFTSAIIAPLVARGRTLGAITLVSAESGRRYGPEDLALAEAFAGRAALEIDNARLYQEVHDQREWLRVTIASIGDAVIATNTRGQITFMNAVAESLTGWSQAAAIGADLHTVFRIVDGTTREPIENPIARVVREGVVIGLANHTVLIAHDGSERPIDDSGAPIRNADGDLVGVVLVFRDITECKQAEETIRASQARYRTLVEVTPQITWTQTPDGTIDYLNQRWAIYTGMPRESRDRGGWRQALHPDDRERAAARAASAILAGEAYELEVRIQRADRSYRWHLVRVVPVKDHGRLLAWIGTAADIHDLKQTEVAQRFLAEASRLLVASLDYETTIVYRPFERPQ